MLRSEVLGQNSSYQRRLEHQNAVRVSRHSFGAVGFGALAALAWRQVEQMMLVNELPTDVHDSRRLRLGSAPCVDGDAARLRYTVRVSRSEFEVSRRKSDSVRAKGRLTLTRAEVINAAARLLDTDGIEKLSMRKLAAVLGTGPSTLYWHVHDREELLLLILDDTVSVVAVRTGGTWDERLTETLVHCHDALLPRPALIDVLWGAAWELGPQTLRVANALIGLVAESGLPDDEVSDTYLALITLLFGFVAGERSSPGNLRYRDVRSGMSSGDDTEQVADLYPNLVRYGPGAAAGEMERRFRYAVDRFVAGIKSRVLELGEGAGQRRTAGTHRASGKTRAGN